MGWKGGGMAPLAPFPSPASLSMAYSEMFHILQVIGKSFVAVSDS